MNGPGGSTATDEATLAFLSRVEDAGLNASAPPEQRWMDGWLLRFSPGKAQRARCINAVAVGRMPIDDKLALAAAAYRDAALPLMLRITPFTQPPSLADRLREMGWRTHDETRVMVWRDMAPTAPETLDGVEAIDAGSYAEVVGALRGTPPTQRAAHAHRMALAPASYRGFVWRGGDGEVMACGQFVREGDLVGLYDVFTSPPFRGRGLAARLCAWMLAQARERGARHAYLQVSADNAAAISVYRRLGFGDGYGYHYLIAD